MLNWLPEGKRGAVCFTIDDVFPGKSTDAYEAGGDMERGALGHLAWLLDRHPKLRVTLFTTPDWREISPVPTRKWLARVPVVRDHFYLAPILPEGTMRLDRHPHFIRYLKSLPRTETALHGLHHVHKGPRIPVEFQEQDADQCRAMLEKAVGIFRQAGVPMSLGMNPPGWNLPQSLGQAMMDVGLRYVASARDINTPVSPTARTAMSGVRGVSLIHPEFIYPDFVVNEKRRLLHFTSNFQATSDDARAHAVITAGGLLGIKAHIVKQAMGHVSLDGLDESYRDRLHHLFTDLENRYGDSLWWTSMGDMHRHLEP
ncbi:MAG TPA: hypothetical protein VGO93_13890 [Candidatus Xenobia bacterium]